MTASCSVSPTDFCTLLASASVEISSHGHQLPELLDNFSGGAEVTITFLPGDNYRHNVETAAALRRSGFNPVPHIAAREMSSREALDDFLARLRGEADVRRVLLIAGDVAGARGPFKSSSDVRATGLLQAHGIARISIAGHPEGHPFLDETGVLNLLSTWQDWAQQTRIGVDIVSQFCFESAPILVLLGKLAESGIGLPLIVGLAGPATPATLTKFALRCGIGSSIRAVRGKIGRYGRLLTDSGPDDVIHGLEAAPRPAIPAIAGFHLFPFGGLRKVRNWLRDYAERTREPVRDALSAHAQNP